MTPSDAAPHHDYDVLLWGMYFCDLIFTGLPGVPRLGHELFSTGFELTTGGCFTSAVALQRLGLRAAWMCDFGTDFFSQFVLEAARQAGLDSRLFQYHDAPLRRVSVAFSSAEDRGFISYMDNLPCTSPVPAIEAHAPRCLLLPHLHYRPVYADVFRVARQYHTLIYMDCQSTSATLDTPGVADALRQTDIFAPNQPEALHLTAAADVNEALDVLLTLTPLVVIKLGADGAVAATRASRVKVPALRVDVVDTTGAGDCFNVGFLYSYLRGLPLEHCLRTANIVGGLSTTGVGGSAVPTWQQVEERLNAGW